MTVFDMDSHLRESYVMDEAFALDGEFANFRPVRLNDERGFKAKFKHSLAPFSTRVNQSFDHDFVYDPDVNWQGGEVARRQMGGIDMDFRIRDNEREGIDVQFMFPTLIMIPCLTEGPLGAALCRAYNNWTHGLAKGRESKIKPIAVLPWANPPAMVAELERCVKELGFTAAHVMPYVSTEKTKLTIDNEAYYPFYEAVHRLNIPLMLHPNSQGDLINLYDNFYAMHVLGRPFNCTAGLIALTIGGIFEKFPNLRVAFFECSAEWVLYWMHRMDDDYRRMKHGMAPKISKLPSEYVKKNCWVTCEADEQELKHAIDGFSEDRILLASDYPHFDSEYPGTLKELRERTDITAKQKEKIVSHNAMEFLGL
ncbi:MAG TPA: amidohydrolase family protein [Candidatus Acidoferrales bacterium]|nr:amidohydrolase family protein [Candidatus Acidoferrales bacterium]